MEDQKELFECSVKIRKEGNKMKERSAAELHSLGLTDRHVPSRMKAIKVSLSFFFRDTC